MIQESMMLNLNGLQMHLVSAGEGPAVLLLHGFPDTHIVWRKQIQFLAEAGFRVIAPDLRGYGKTDAPAEPEAYAMAYLCADVLALLDALGLDKVSLVGHDWGAALGWRLCADAPDRFERFTALSVGHLKAVLGAGIGQRLRFFYMAIFCIPGFSEWLLKAGNWRIVRNLTRDRSQAEHWIRDLSPKGRLTAALNYYRANIKPQRGRGSSVVKVPVMGVWSDGDSALGERQMVDSAAYVQAGFRYEPIEGADHWMQLTAPDRVNALLLDFLRAAPACL
jgi:pimeloyl-ACP methyl ester carboxylesterase